MSSRVGCWLCLLLAMTAAAAGNEPNPNASVQLRLEWGGGPPLRWSGTLELSEGVLRDPVSLAVEGSDPRSLWIDNGIIRIDRLSPRVYDGLDVIAEAPPDAELSITLQSLEAPHVRRQLRIPLRELCTAIKVVPLGTEDCNLSIRRTPGDALRVTLSRSHLIFAPAETLDGDVLLNSISPDGLHPGGTLEWTLSPARTTEVLNRGQHSTEAAQPGASPKIPLQIPLPEDEGVYDVRLRFTGGGMMDVERTIQVVVLKSEPDRRRLPANEAGQTLVDEFDAANAAGDRRLAASSQHPPWSKPWARFLSMLPGVLDDVASAPKVSQTTRTIRWQAYRLKLEHPGQAHRLEVTIAPPYEGSVGISILEPNAVGQLMPLGADSGIHLSQLPDGPAVPASDRTQPLKHELIFWPKVRDPVLLVHDLGTGSQATVGSVRVHELAEIEPSDPKPDSPAGSPKRLVGPYMHKPLLPENFGGTEWLDQSSQRSLDDWLTFYAASQRLVSWLLHQGSNSLMLAVAADGSGIYPSPLLEPTPRYDTGIYFSTGQDPIRKDVLELLFRLFDRESLVLVPELQFSMPLPALERQLAEAPDQSRGIELIGRDGRNWRESHTSTRGSAPYYNPLDPRVQQAVLAVVRELVERYRAHPSFEGLAVELSSVGYLQLPGLDWGYDDATIARFEQATGTKVPLGESDDRFRARHEFLTTTARFPWMRWRADELSRFHHAMAAVVTESKPSARFVLAGNRVLRGSNPDDNIYDSLTSGGKLDALLQPKGLDLQLLSDVERLTVLRPQLVSSSDRVLGSTLDDSINDSPNLDDAFRVGAPGTLVYHLPQPCRISEFDAVSPWQPAYTWLLTHVAENDLENRKRIAHALAALDAQVLFEGGWMTSLTPAGGQRRLRTIVQSIPAAKFQRVPDQTQPIVVRFAYLQGRTYLYAVNDFPQAVRATIKLSCPPDTACRLLGVSEKCVLSGDGTGGSVVEMNLSPYDIWACELQTNVRVVNILVDVPSTAITGLQERIATISRMLTLAKQEAANGTLILANPGFEETDLNRPLEGWNLPVQNAEFWTIDHRNPRSGDSSLRLASAGDHTVLQSRELPIEGARFLSMTVWMRSNRPDAEVRLVFQGEFDGQPHVQSAPVRVGQEWRRYVFRVPDLPANRLHDARIRIELAGPGELWIDDVDLQAHQLTPDDIRQVTKVLSAASLSVKEGRYRDCQRLLDGYWGQLLFINPVPADPVVSEPARGNSNTFRLPKLIRR